VKKIIFAISSFAFANLQINAQGLSYQWTKQFGATNTASVKKSITDGSGNIYSIGDFYGTVDFDSGTGITNLTSGGQSDVFVLKTDASGVFNWAFKIGSAQFESASSITLDNAGQLAITGKYRTTVDFDPSASTFNLSSVSASYDGFIATYSAGGNFINAITLGGSLQSDVVIDAKFNANNDLFVVGNFEGTVDFDPSVISNTLTSIGGSDAFFASYTSSLTLNWVHAIATPSNDIISALAIDASNDIIITGGFSGTCDFNPSVATTTLTAIANYDIYVAKYDMAGNYIFCFTIGTANSVWGDVANCIAVNSLNEIIIGGYYGPATIDFDPSLTTASVSQSSFYQHAFIAKYTDAGTYQWAKPISSNYCTGAAANTLNVTTNNDILIGGVYSGSLQPQGAFGPYAGNAGSNDLFLISYSNNGTYLYDHTFGGIGSDVLNSIDIKATEVIISGAFGSNVDFDFSVTTNSLTAVGSTDGYVAKYLLPLTTNIGSNNFSSNILIYPNPTKGLFTVETTNLLSSAIIQLSDVIGRVVLDKTITSTKEQIEISDLNTGVYFLKIKNGDKQFITKIIKQ
jgi:hypothetical protein